MNPLLIINWCYSQIGKDMEVKFFDSLKAHKISYISEHELFKLGYPKTPDALLSVPVALPVPGGNGRSSTIINWIESKAFFGNVRQHEMYLQKQYWAYHNRYIDIAFYLTTFSS